MERDIDVVPHSYVTGLAVDSSGHRQVRVLSERGGLATVECRSVVLAMGCRERPRGALAIPGTRPAGIYTAGTAQRRVNMEGYMPGERYGILGSGDIGMIMARRLTLEGCKVAAVVEILPYLAGLTRNRVQCLDDFGIPLLLSHTVTEINGLDRMESVCISPVDDNMKPILSESKTVPCDTLLLSVGLIPENELSRSAHVPVSLVTRGALVNQHMQTDIPGIFACGNALHVNDLVDHVSREGELAGRNATLYIRGQLPGGNSVLVAHDESIRYVCPQRILRGDPEDVTLYFRASTPQQGVRITAKGDGQVLASRRAIAVNPGEIESITIKKEKMDGIDPDIILKIEAETE
jgi:NADPH-dependent 2,4-dienoyl-CoA reductase/sulfur reductase-like enzyme